MLGRPCRRSPRSEPERRRAPTRASPEGVRDSFAGPVATRARPVGCTGVERATDPSRSETEIVAASEKACRPCFPRACWPGTLAGQELGLFRPHTLVLIHIYFLLVSSTDGDGFERASAREQASTALPVLSTYVKARSSASLTGASSCVRVGVAPVEKRPWRKPPRPRGLALASRFH